MPRQPGLVAILLTTILGGCGPSASQTPAKTAAPTPSVPPPLVFATDNDDEALRGVAAHFRALGWKTTDDASLKQVVLVSPRNRKYGVRAALQGKGAMDRLVVFKAFALKPEAKGNPKVAELVAKLNNEVSGVVYQVSTDGAIICTVWLYFLDALDTRVLTGAIELLDEVAVPLVAQKVPELMSLLE